MTFSPKSIVIGDCSEKAQEISRHWKTRLAKLSCDWSGKRRRKFPATGRHVWPNSIVIGDCREKAQEISRHWEGWPNSLVIGDCREKAPVVDTGGQTLWRLGTEQLFLPKYLEQNINRT